MANESIDTDALTKLQPSRMISETFIERHHKTTARGERIPDPSIDAMAQVVRRAKDTCNSVVTLGKTLAVDPTMMPAAKAIALRDRASKGLDAVIKRSDEVNQSIAGELARIKADLDRLPTPASQVDSMLEGEMRAALARMTDEDRGKAIADSLEGDQRVIAAALRGPAMLSGLRETQQGYWKTRWRESRDPAAVERLARLEEAKNAFDRSMDGVVDFYAAASNLEGIQQALQAQEMTARALASVGGD